MEKEMFHISVRYLVEFILRSGDIDSHRGGFANRDAMAAGSRLHRKIQRQMGAGYQAEVPLSYVKNYDEFSIAVEGRADGIVDENQEVLVDEIKGIYRDLHFLEEAYEVHLAQAKCYGYIYGVQNQKQKVKVQMTYCNLETEEVKRFVKEYSLEELESWFFWLMDQYYQWALWQYEWKRLRDNSMVGLEFPFEYREGQREVVSSVYRTIMRKNQLFIQAPTGVGKTMSTIFPAVRSMGEGLSEKIFYLTAKTITRTVAWEAFRILKAHGLKMKILTITAKEKLCACEEVECDPIHCPRAKGHYDRINEAVYELLQKEEFFDQDILVAYAEKYQVCPYEMCLDTAAWVDAVICDYNYVFDPVVHLKRFFGEGIKGSYVFLIDEAHNLVERGREMFSCTLWKEDFLAIKKMVKPYSKKLERVLERCNRQMLEWKRECETWKELESIGAFSLALLNVVGELENLLEDLADGELRKVVLEFYFQVRLFLYIVELLDENYVIYTRHDEEGRFCVRLCCVNPAANLQSCLDKGVSTIFFSATLLPIGYYRSLLSGREDDYAIYAHTPFLAEQKKVLIGRDVSSLYTRRGPEEYAKIAEYIHIVASGHKGNYMVFFPSYRLLQDVYESYISNYPEKNISVVCQNSSMQEKEREEFLSHFEDDREETLLGFCVLGGIFAEGIDLTGEKLVGAIIVGTGLPQVDYEKEILKNYYNRKGENGFDYAYRFPGMNKVLQAGGRVIRTQHDRGIILLLDERFCSSDYRNLFPREWENHEIHTRRTIGDALETFWREEL